MTFQGDVEQIPISNIVQALFLNGQEGVLSVDSGTIKRKFRILKLGIRPLMSSPEDLTILRATLLKERILTEQQFDNAMSSWNSTTLFPGDFLLQRRVVTPEQVEHCLRKQFEEAIYEVLTARDLRYEFSAGQHCNDHEFFDPDGLGNLLIFSVNGVLMEAVRREDEWRRIEEEVPTGYEIYCSVSKGLPTTVPADIELPAVPYKEMCKLLTGDRSVERIVAESVLSRYEVYHALFQLKSHGYIRRLRLNEKESLADKLRRLVKNLEAIDVYRSILDEDETNVRTRIQLIFLLEKGGNHPDLLIEHYLALVDQFESSESEKALSYAQKILGLDPDNLLAHEKIFVIYALAGDRSAAMGALRSLLETVKNDSRYQDGADVLMRALNHFPEETTIYHELADLLMASNQNDLAVDCLKSVAELYGQGGDIQRQLKTYELIVRIDPTEQATLRKISGESKRAQISTNDLVKLSVLSVVIGILLVVISYFGFVEMDSRRVYALTREATGVQTRYTKFDRARNTVQDFLNAYRFSTRKKVATELFDQIDREEKTHRAKLDNTRNELVRILGTTLHKAERAIKLGNYIEAKDVLSGAIYEAKQYENQLTGEFASKFGRIQTLLGKVNIYLGGAERLVSQIVQARKVNDLGSAHRHALDLLKSYPQSSEADGLKIGILIESTPPGATLVFGHQKFGKTPVVVDVPPRRLIAGKLERPGYRDTPIQIRPTKEWKVHFGLEKLPSWAFDSGGPIDGAPYGADHLLFFGNRDGRIFCLNRQGKKKWPGFKVPLDISGGVAFWNNIVSAGSFDGNVYLLNASTGTPRGSVLKATTTNESIKRAPSEPSSLGVTAFNCGDKFLVGVDMMTGQRKWSYASPGPLAGAPQLDGDTLYCFLAQGHLLELDPHTSLPKGKLKRHIRLESGLAHPGTIVGGIAYLGYASGEIRAFDLKSQKVKWATSLASAPTAPPTISVESGVAIVPLASEEIVCIELSTGAERWRREITSEAQKLTTSQEKIQVGSIDAVGAIDKRCYYVGSRYGYILCWRLEDGVLEWTYQTMGATEQPRKGIASKGLLHGGYFYQGSDDGHLYCFSVESH